VITVKCRSAKILLFLSDVYKKSFFIFGGINDFFLADYL